jgi:hypothetical protein
LGSDLPNFRCNFLYDCAATKLGTWSCGRGFSEKKTFCRFFPWLHLESSLFSWWLFSHLWSKLTRASLKSS